MFDILIPGELNPDLILSGDVIPEFGQVEKLVDSASLTIGSSSAIFACGAAKLGLKVAFVGICGDDVFGRYMLAGLEACGVDVSGVIVDPDTQTGLSVIFARGSDRAILTHPGSMGALKAEQVTAAMLQGARHLHIASYFLQAGLQPGLPDLFVRARCSGLTTSIDTNWDPSGKWRCVRELLPFVDVFLPNQNEAMAISGAASLEGALNTLSQTCRVVGVKCGSLGAVSRQGERTASVPALPFPVVDTVGAGDNFDAGFLYGWLNGMSQEGTLSLAVACGSLSTRAAGGVSAQPTLAEAMAYV